MAVPWTDYDLPIRDGDALWNAAILDGFVRGIAGEIHYPGLKDTDRVWIVARGINRTGKYGTDSPTAGQYGYHSIYPNTEVATAKNDPAFTDAAFYSMITIDRLIVHVKHMP